MRQLLSGIALAAMIATGAGAPVHAQNLFQTVVYVNDSAVTRYEIVQRQRFMQVIGAPETSAQAAEDALIDDRLRVEAAERIGVQLSDEALQSGLEEFAGRAGLDAASFIARLEQAGVDGDTFRDFVRAGSMWRQVVRARLLSQIDISDAEVDQQLKRVIETPIIDRVSLSELIIPAPPGQEAQALSLAERIAGSRPSEAQFADATRRYSATPSAEAGGRLETMELDSLPPGLRQIVTQLQPGETTQPLQVEGAVILFHLRDAQGSLRPGAREQVLEYATITLPDMARANAVAQATLSCDDLYKQVGPEAALQVQRQTLSQAQIPTLIAARLASLDDGESGVVPVGNAAEVVTLCSRQPALAQQAEVPTTAQPQDGVEDAIPQPENGIPSREAVRDELFNQRINEAAEGLLADLRADALIRRP
ncbi:peptidylprolyl isomerase [Paracoccus sp. 1_MG-2023]|uniref:peptidylprolyl isomerase n=1 Tax=unclassified Paracoccus (in: a-proteobacteria) TaxID=2688777 RepID=UPI001C080C1D|nr:MULTISPECIES: peptidylprolyl isomerase [unclassified Paracoccus (in: a-proteobacteria)]MBU2956398.1 peptidylprolyl isomerase [Paracoccus sp. C2R09]MDO6669868.1 peptidylprolyl isomerase [Paracoccus sp. 1_MG-2023]